LKFGKQAKADKWGSQAAAYSLAVIQWTKIVREMPGSIRVHDAANRSAFFAAETSRSHLERTRERLNREAGKLGIDTPLPEAVWPDRLTPRQDGS
jgi:hypothetical protein